MFYIVARLSYHEAHQNTIRKYSASRKVICVKITDVKAHLLSCPYPSDFRWDLGLGSGVKRDEVIVFVETDEGVTGIGESYHGFAPEAIKSYVENYYKPLLVGQDPSDIEGLWNKMYFATLQHGNAGVLAVSGVNVALWDIRGKVLGEPVYKLLGGSHKTRIPAYIGCHCFGWKAPELLLEEARGYVAKGFKAIKLRGGMGVHRDLEAVRVCREGLGPDIAIMIDANSAYTAPEAVQLARMLTEYDTFFFESPFDFTLHNHHRDMARLRGMNATPIASGGNLFTRFQYRDLILHGGVDYVTPDAGKCGGLSEAIRIASMASAFGVLIAPHSTAGLNMMANLHFTAAIPDHIMCYMEWDEASFCPPRDEVLTNPIAVENGYLVLPDKPGLGTEINPEALEKYPFIPGAEIVSKPRTRRWASAE